MPDISHKDAGFVVVVTFVIFAAIVFTGIYYVSKYLDGREPRTLKEVFDRVTADLDKDNTSSAISTLYAYLRHVEANPMQHMEIGPIFALLAKTRLRLKEAAGAFYFARIAENYYELFDVVVDPSDEASTLFGNLRIENEKTEAQAGLLLAPEAQSEISAKIDSHRSAGDVRNSADWIRLGPV